MIPVENMSAPRALFDQLPDFGKRAVWCHQNCWESISIHAPACVLCLITLPDSNLSLIAAWMHPLLRFLYIVIWKRVRILEDSFWTSYLAAVTYLWAISLTIISKHISPLSMRVFKIVAKNTPYTFEEIR